MLYWAVVFLVIALVAALFGFGGIASAAAGIAKFLFFLFVVVFVILLVMGLIGRRRALYERGGRTTRAAGSLMHEDRLAQPAAHAASSPHATWSI